MRDSALRARCEQRVRELDIPQPFSLAEFCRRLGEERGRPLALHPMHDETPGLPSGVWMAGERSDHIFYDDRTSPLHQEHIVLHEIGHMIADHEPPSVLDLADAAMLMPSLDGEVVARVLARTAYARDDEREAELLATLIAQRAGRPAQHHDPENDALRERLRSALG